MKKNLLVAGGTGFLGYHVAKQGLIRGFNVFSLSKNEPTEKRFIPGLNYINIDLLDTEGLFNCINDLKIEYVVNCVGYVDHKLFKDGGDDVFDNHFTVTKNLTKSLDKKFLKCFLQIGSSDEYGDNPSPQIEKMRESPISPYSLAKVASCHLLQMLYKTEDFPVAILRLFLVYGSNLNKERFLSNIIYNSIRNKNFAVSPGEQIRDFCYVDDVVNAIFLSLENKNIYGEIINIASGKPITIKEIVNLVNTILKKGKPVFGGINYRENESMNLYASIEKARHLLKWEPKTTLEEGILKTINWYKKNDQ